MAKYELLKKWHVFRMNEHGQLELDIDLDSYGYDTKEEAENQILKGNYWKPRFIIEGTSSVYVIDSKACSNCGSKNCVWTKENRQAPGCWQEKDIK
jgi:hypothetical protein